MILNAKINAGELLIFLGDMHFFDEVEEIKSVRINAFNINVAI
jgi:hypothetical protein